MLNRKLKHETKELFIAFSDGSCDNLNPLRPGGSAYIILDTDGNVIKKMSKGFMHTTSNRMELLAIISIVNSLPEFSFVTINTDSEYCIKALLSNQPKANLDLIRKYYDIRNKKDITVYLHHVKGHAGNKYNELCDQMARGEYVKMLNKASEEGYSCITTKGRRKGTKKKRR
jgi:ribonuclease HI